MFWPKKIILIDFETTGLDKVTSEWHELGALLINNETLEVESEFETQCKIYYPEHASLEALKLANLKKEDLANREKDPNSSICEFDSWVREHGTKDYFNFATWNSYFDMFWVEHAYYHNKTLKFGDFDHHTICLWTLFSIYRKLLGAKDNLTGVKQALRELGEYEDALEYTHTALHDCYSEYKILKTVLTSIDNA